MKVAVVGGSLGGLTAACLLRDLGHEVDVYERSPTELEDRGAGIGLLDTTSQYLVERVGMPIDDLSVATSRIRYLHRDGSVAHDEAHEYRFSSWTTVYRGLLSAFGRSRYHLGREMAKVSSHDDGAEVTFVDGTGVRVDLVVCADGVGSTARSQLSAGVRASYAGYVAWRAMVLESMLDASTQEVLADAITYFVYANSHVLVYPIPGVDGSAIAGRRLINLVWYRNYLAGEDLDDLMTDTSGERRAVSLRPGTVRAEHVAELKAHAFARLPAPIAAVIDRCSQPFVQVVLDGEVNRMAFGRVCLMGDAAFVARPHAAAGTAKAASDAWSLADVIDRHVGRGEQRVQGERIVAALAEWEVGRLELGRQLLARTRRIGQRSQFDGTWAPGDPELIFGLYEPGR